MSCCRNDNKWGEKQRDTVGNVDKKGKIIQVGKGGEKGREGKSRARGDQNRILKVRVKLFCSLMAYFPSLWSIL